MSNKPEIFEITGAPYKSDAALWDEKTGEIPRARRSRQLRRVLNEAETKKPNYRLRRAVAASAATIALAGAPAAIESGGQHLLNAGEAIVEHVTDDPDFGPEPPTAEQQQRMGETSVGQTK